MSIRQINQSHRYSNVKYIVKSHNMFGIYHRMRFFRYHSTITKECRPSVMKYISPDLHALLWCEIEFPVGHVEESVPVVEECHDDIDAVLGY